MKRFCYLVLCVLLVCVFSIPVSAAEIYANAGELYQAWYDDMPDEITGVWSTDGSSSNLTFGICADADVDAVQDRILSLVENDVSVSFSVQKYSLNTLRRIQEELFAYFPRAEKDVNYGLISLGIYDDENIVVVEFLESERDDPETVALIEKITQQYGDAIAITYGEEYVHTMEDILTVAPIILKEQNGPSFAVWIGVLGAGCVCFSAVLAYQRKKQSLAVFQAVDGAEAVSEPLCDEEVENMIRASEVGLSDGVEQRIMQKIDEMK